MSSRRQGDLPGYLRMGERVKSTAIHLAAEHYAASAFKGSPEILLHHGDTDSQWSIMYQEMMDDTSIPEMDRSYLDRQRNNLAKWIAISTMEIKARAARQYPDLDLDVQVVELTKGRGPGRPPLDPKEAERRKLEKESASPTRGRGRPTLTDAEKADAAAQRLKDPSRPTLGRPPGTTKVKKLSSTEKIVSGQRMRRIVSPVLTVEKQAAIDVGQDYQTQLKLEALETMLEKVDEFGDPIITKQRYIERVASILEAAGLTQEDLHSGIVGPIRTRPSEIPEKVKIEFVRRRPDEEKSTEDIIDQTIPGIPIIFEEEEEEDVLVQQVEEEPEDPRLYQ